MMGHLRAGGEGVTCCRVLNPPALFQHQCAQPTVFALVVLDVVLRSLGDTFVGVHHVRVHHSTCAEEGEAARAGKCVEIGGLTSYLTQINATRKKEITILVYHTCREHSPAYVPLPSGANGQWHIQTFGIAACT